jgi:putative ABC transport system ATP-binding protein
MTGFTLREVRLDRPGTPGFTLRVPHWTVPAGTRVALRGPSGSGKSTLLGLLSGELSPTSGTLDVLGAALHELDAPARAAFRLRRVGMVLQDDTLLPWLSIRDNVLLPYRLGPALPRDPEAGARAISLLTALGLAGRSDAWPGRLSAGERQRVAVARALITRPDLLLADEPTSALDPHSAAAVLQAIDRLCAERGTTAVVVTHDDTLAAALPQTVRMAKLRGGA